MKLPAMHRYGKANHNRLSLADDSNPLLNTRQVWKVLQKWVVAKALIATLEDRTSLSREMHRFELCRVL
jgi:hypothetical protein